jgi:hypothetical protein
VVPQSNGTFFYQDIVLTFNGNSSSNGNAIPLYFVITSIKDTEAVVNGVSGLKGDKGDIGPVGPAGAVGAKGPAGATGVAGTDGKTLLSGTSAPVAGTGNNGCGIRSRR